MDVYKKKAEKIGVTISKSKNPDKKFDVFKDGVKQASIGASGYMDFEKYKKRDGIKVANKRRENYRARHKENISVKMRDGKLTPGYLSSKILW